jgi:hypothetical protein
MQSGVTAIRRTLPGGERALKSLAAIGVAEMYVRAG